MHDEPGAEGHDQVIVVGPGNLCDFCSTPVDPTAAWMFDIKPVWAREYGAHGYTDHVLDEHWLACQPCKDLFEAGDLDGLYKRVIGLHATGDLREVPLHLVMRYWNQARENLEDPKAKPFKGHGRH